MKYAITFENNKVFQHFGKCQEFLIVCFENGSIVHKELVNSNGQGHSALVIFLKESQVDTLICGGIGQGARSALLENGIGLISGAQGQIDIILNKLSKGTLVDDPSGVCNHHREDGNDHHCGERGHCH